MAQCQAVKDNGEPCQATPEFVDPETGFCPAHDPTRPNEMKERGRSGGLKSAEVRRKAKGLHPDELPDLRTHEDAKIWLEVVGRAVSTGRLGDREAQAAIRAVSEWVKTAAEEATREVVDELKAEIDRLKDEVDERSRPW